MTAVIQITRRKYYREAITMGLILVIALMSVAFNTAKGAALTGERDTISDSKPDQVADHTVRFIANNAFAVDETLTITFASNFDTSALTAPGDFDLSYGTAGTNTEVLLSATAAGVNSWLVAVSGDVVTFVTASGATSLPGAGEIVIVEIGKNATAQAAGANQTTNPSKSAAAGTADILSLDLVYDGNGVNDTGTALMAIIEGVTVSATVAETLTAKIDGTVSGADCDTSFRVEADATTVNNTTVAFGALASDTFKHACQDLVVATNASNGFSVTAEENTALFESSGNNTIDNFNENSATASTAGAWGTGYGFGFACLEQNGGSICDEAYSDANSLYRPFADSSLSYSAEKFMDSATSTTATARVDYRVYISAAQQAGSYSNVITYIFTPTF